jgi:hypothetical protein
MKQFTILIGSNGMYRLTKRNGELIGTYDTLSAAMYECLDENLEPVNVLIYSIDHIK